MTPKAEEIIDFISDAINDLFFELYDKYTGLNIQFVVEVIPGSTEAVGLSTEMYKQERRY